MIVHGGSLNKMQSQNSSVGVHGFVGDGIDAVVDARDEVATGRMVEAFVGTEDELGTVHGLGGSDVPFQFDVMGLGGAGRVGVADGDDGADRGRHVGSFL